MTNSDSSILPNINQMDQMVSEPSWPQFNGLYFKLPGIHISNIDFLIANVMLLLPHAKIIFSQRGATDLQKKYLASALS